MKVTGKTNLCKSIATLLSLLVLLTCFSTPVQAGVVENKMPLTADGKLNSTDWFDAEDSTFVENGQLVIPADSTLDTRIISKMLAVRDQAYKNMAEMSGTLCFRQLPQGEKFVVALGLDSVEAYSGEAENLEITFVNNGSIQASVIRFDEDEKAVELAPARSIGAGLGSKISLTIILTTDNGLTVTVNGKTLCSLNGVENAEGRVGFLQSGNCAVEIGDWTTDFTHYDRPENTNLSEDFEKEVYNDNLFSVNYSTSARTPSYIAVEQYGGSNVLMFYNTRLAYFGTKYAYSNFELTFDVPYFLRNSVKSESGRTVAAPTQEFLVSFGDDAQELTGYGYTASTDTLRFTRNTVHSYNQTKEKFRVNYVEKGYADEKTNQGFSVRLRMVDGHLTVAMKSLGASGFEKIAEADYENFKTGYIKFWSANDATFAIDNLTITNLDEGANLKEVAFKGATVTQADYDYQSSELKFRAAEDTKDAETVHVKTIVIVSTLAGCILILAVSIIVVAVRKKKGDKRAKEVTEHEI